MITTLITVLMMPSQGGDGKLWGNLLFLVAIMLIFYFFMIRPQTKKAKDQRKFLEAIAKGDKIVTNGGIYGKIIGITDKCYIIESEGGTKLKIDKSAISMEMSKRNVE